jgi:lipopolysaccharide export LptBFGC system permease protein LptF
MLTPPSGLAAHLLFARQHTFTTAQAIENCLAGLSVINTTGLREVTLNMLDNDHYQFQLVEYQRQRRGRLQRVRYLSGTFTRAGGGTEVAVTAYNDGSFWLILLAVAAAAVIFALPTMRSSLIFVGPVMMLIFGFALYSVVAGRQRLLADLRHVLKADV